MDAEALREKALERHIEDIKRWRKDNPGIEKAFEEARNLDPNTPMPLGFPRYDEPHIEKMKDEHTRMARFLRSLSASIKVLTLPNILKGDVDSFLTRINEPPEKNEPAKNWDQHPSMSYLDLRLWLDKMTDEELADPVGVWMEDEGNLYGITTTQVMNDDPKMDDIPLDNGVPMLVVEKPWEVEGE